MAYTNIMYFHRISAIGGIEEYFYQLGQLYHNLDVTIFYRVADKQQLNRLRKYFRCIEYHDETIECERAFFNFNLDIIDNVKAKEYICVLHGDYKDMVLRGQIAAPPTHPKITRYVGVSKLVCNSFTELTGLKCELSYNPYTIPPKKKIYRFALAQRFTKEKGQSRVLELISKLNIPFTMDIFTNSPFKVSNENVHFYAPRLDIASYLTPDNYDFFVILSDNEGYCYGAVEALSNGLPVIATHLPVFDELGLNNSNTIWFEDFSCDKLDHKFNFEFNAPKDNWNALFIDKKTTYEGVNMKKIKAVQKYFDTQLMKNVQVGDVYEVDDERANVILNAGFCEILEEVKEKKSVKKARK